MAGLRERRHSETRQQLVDAAFALFGARGFESVTMEEVAVAAGVSRSTAYRRFPTKEDLVLEIPRRWLDAFDAAHDRLAPGTTLREAMRDTAMAVALHIDEHREVVLAAYRVLAEAPSLQSASVATSAWLQRMSDLVTRFSDVDDETAAMLAGAYFGGIEAMMQHWATTGGTARVADSTARLLDLLSPTLPSSPTGSPSRSAGTAD